MDAIFRLVLFILCSTFSLFAQDFQGLATYKTQRKLELKIDSTQVGASGEMQKQIMAMLKKAIPKNLSFLHSTKTPQFIKKTKHWHHQLPGSGMLLWSFLQMGGSGCFHCIRTLKIQSFTNQKETFGKQFISQRPITAN